MTLFLASVTGVEEAEIALAHGADIVDLKDPSAGALGALPIEVVRAAVAAIGGRRPVSAVTGDLPMQPDKLVAAARAMAQTGVDYVKVGLFPAAERQACIRALASVAASCKLVGVMFADRGADETLLPLMASCGFAGAMLDTAGKESGALLDHIDMSALKNFVAACRTHGLLSGLAGSLEAPDIPRLLVLAPDYLGFRRALCSGHERIGHIAPDAVEIIRGLIPLDRRSPAYGETAESKVDYRLLAARGYSIDPKDPALTDRVFVHDFVLPVRIGAYAREHEKPQNIRFNVELKVLRPGHAAEDMRDVFSYDVITDGIRMLVAQEHIELVEMLAERIATFLLEDTRVREATVRVEKLDVGPGSVGVEIRRERSAEVADVRRLYPFAREGDPKAAE